MSLNDAITAASSGNSAGRYRTFTCFARLPPEIRKSVWKFSAFIPRNIDLRVGFMQFIQLNGTVIDEAHYFYSTVPPPAILHTCREARLEGLKVYKLRFGARSSSSRRNRPTFTISFEPRIYLNRQTDRICIVDQGDYKARGLGVYCDLAEQVRDSNLAHLAINMRRSSWEFYFHEFAIFLRLIFVHTWKNVNEYIIFESHQTPDPFQSVLEFEDIDETYLHSTRLLDIKRWFDQEIENIKEGTRKQHIVGWGIPEEVVDAWIRDHDWWKVRMCRSVWNDF
jgi:hypothetical protein